MPSRFDLYGRIIIQGVSTAVSNISRVERSFRSLGRGIAGARQAAYGVSQLAGAISMLGRYATMGLSYSAKKFTDFEYAISGVYAVLAREGGKHNELLAKRAKQLGATTVWTATQVANAMQELARSGFDGMQVYEAIPHVLNMAAAEGMGLSRATAITASTLRAFSYEAKDARRVADLLASVSVASATNIDQLGNALRYVSGTAATVGMSLEDTLKSLGLVANFSLKASIGGTSFNQALTQIVKGVSKPNGAIRKLVHTFEDAKGHFIGMSTKGGIIDQISDSLSKYGSDLQKAAVLTEAFNIRGARNVAALVKAFDKTSATTVKAFQNLEDSMAHASDGIGMSAKMAEIRIANLKGAVTLLLSALETFSIETFTTISGVARKETLSISQYIASLGQSLMYLNTDTAKLTSEDKKMWKSMSTTVKDTAAGIIDGFDRVKKKYLEIKDVVFNTFDIKNWGGDVKSAASDLTLFTVGLAATVPVIAGVSLGARGLTGSLDLLIGTFKLLWSPIGWAIPPVAIALMALGDEGETAFDTLIRLGKRFHNIIDALLAPLRVLRQAIGDLGTVAATVLGFKLLQLGSGFIGGTLAGKAAGTRMGAGIGGAFGAQKVIVTNWPPGLMVPGGVGGGAAAGAAGAGAAGTAARGALGVVLGSLGTVALIGVTAAVLAGLSASVIGAIAGKAKKAAEEERLRTEEKKKAREEAARVSSVRIHDDIVRGIKDEQRAKGYSAEQVFSAITGRGYIDPKTGQKVSVGKTDTGPFAEYWSDARFLFEKGAKDRALSMVTDLEKYGVTTNIGDVRPNIRPIIDDERQRKLAIYREQMYATNPPDIAFQKFSEKVAESLGPQWLEFNKHWDEIRSSLRTIADNGRKPLNIKIQESDLNVASTLKGQKSKTTTITVT